MSFYDLLCFVVPTRAVAVMMYCAVAGPCAFIIRLCVTVMFVPGTPYTNIRDSDSQNKGMAEHHGMSDVDALFALLCVCVCVFKGG